MIRPNNYKPQQHILPLLLLLLILLGFYWPYTLGFTLPKGDSVLPWSYFSFLLFGWADQGSFLLWNPYAYTGVDMSSAYMLFGFAPNNPIVQLFIPVAAMLQLPSQVALYYYYFLYAYLGAVGAYFLGLHYLYGNRASSFVIALLLICSGYYISVVTHPHLLLTVGMMPLSIYWGLRALEKSSFRSVVFFALVLSVLAGNSYPSGTLGVVLGLIGFLVPVIVFQYRNTSISTHEWLIKLGTLIGFGLFFSLGTLLVAYEYSRDIGKYLEIPSWNFWGMSFSPDIQTSDFRWLTSIFIPSFHMNMADNPCNGANLCAPFYYLGFISPLLAMFGFFSLIRRKAWVWVASITLLTFLGVLYVQGQMMGFRIHPKMALLSKFPFYYRSFILFGVVLLMGFGFDALYRRRAYRKATSVGSIPGTLRLEFGKFKLVLFRGGRLELATDPFFWGIPLLLAISYNALKQFQEISGQKFFFVSTWYMTLLGALYFAVLVSRRIHRRAFAALFVALVSFDLYFYLSTTLPYTDKFIRSNDEAPHFELANANRWVRPPSSIGIIHTHSLPSMHFNEGGTFYRQSSGSQSVHNDIRAHVFLNGLNRLNLPDYEAYHAAGIGRSRFVFSDEAILVDQYHDIFPTLNLLRRPRSNRGDSFNPVILNRFDTDLLGAGEWPTPKIRIVSPEDYQRRASAQDTEWTVQTFGPDDFQLAVIKPEGANQGPVYRLETPLPDWGCLLTEASTVESLCLSVLDEQDRSIYPNTGDLFHQQLAQAPSRRTYFAVKKVNQFFSTYRRNGKTYLYLRTQGSPKITLLFPKRQPANGRFSSPAIKHHLSTSIEPEDFRYVGAEGAYFDDWMKFQAGISGIPTQLGRELQSRFSLFDSNGAKIPWGEFSTANYQSFSLDNGLLHYQTQWEASPSIDRQAMQLEYSLFERDNYQGTGMTILEDQAEYAALNVSQPKPGLLVTRIGYNPSWTAWVDGEQIAPLPVNGLFLAVPVPAGEHHVEIRYQGIPGQKLLIKSTWLWGILLPILMWTGFPKGLKGWINNKLRKA